MPGGEGYLLRGCDLCGMVGGGKGYLQVGVLRGFGKTRGEVF